MRLKYLFLFILPLLVVEKLAAQTKQDSLTIVLAKWQQKEIKKGITWKQTHFENLFDSQQEINLIEIDLNNKKLKLGLEGFADTLFLTSAIAAQTNAAAAINGGFFDTQHGGGTTFVKKEGQIVNKTTLLDKNNKRTERSNGALVLNGKKTHIAAGKIANEKWDEDIRAVNIMVCGPLLIFDNSIKQLSKDAFNDNRHPRSAVALTADHKLYLLTVDGRNAKAQGMNLHELSFLLKALGAKEALNLDGGGSTTLYVRNEGLDGVVNYPSDNKLFDHAGERKVANMILVY